MVYEHLMIWIFPSTNFKLFECVYRLKYVTVFKRKKLQVNLPVELKGECMVYICSGARASKLFFLKPNFSVWNSANNTIPNFTKIHSFRDELILTPEIESITFVLLEAPAQLGF